LGSPAGQVPRFLPDLAHRSNLTGVEHVCAEDNHHFEIGKENYFLSVDGYLMPTRKDQPPPDMRYFDQSRN